MRHLWIIILVISFSDIKAYTVDDIKAEYATIFTARVQHYEGETYVTTNINKLPDAHFLAAFVNKNTMYVKYILINYSTVDWKKLKTLQADTVELNNFLINSLLTDNIFNKYFLEATYYYLTSVGQKITDHKTQDKLKITPDSLAAIATRFFYATNLSDKGEAQWYVCVGKNGYRNDKKDNMIPLIEAFCFMTVMTDLKTEEFNAFSDFKKNIKKLEKQKTDKEGDEKLDYYRQTMYQMMGQSEKLRALLLDKYNKTKDILNFELT